jgi:hypothetical protein
VRTDLFPTENQGFILTSNRDEAVSRVLAIPPKKYQLGGQYVFFPKDPQGDGTWIEVVEISHFVC